MQNVPGFQNCIRNAALIDGKCSLKYNCYDKILRGGNVCSIGVTWCYAKIYIIYVGKNQYSVK